MCLRKQAAEAAVVLLIALELVVHKAVQAWAVAVVLPEPALVEVAVPYVAAAWVEVAVALAVAVALELVVHKAVHA